MSAHTPGPWEVKFSKSGYPYQIHAPNGSRGAGGIRDVTRWAAISLPSSEQGLANARLMAAAPDMYDTLSKLRAALAEMDAELHAQNIAVIDLTLADARGES